MQDREVCKKPNCNNTNANHKAKFVHHCKQGKSCSRKDAEHLAAFLHPDSTQGSTKPAGKSNARYTGVELRDDSRTKLLKRFRSECPQGWRIIAEHMTMYLGGFNPDLKPEVSLGQEIELRVVALGKSEIAMAVKVEGSVPCTNKIPHVTIAIGPGGKPMQSNHITDWEDLDEELILYGHVKEKK
eukprot:TRINITY_DN12926_c0_g1_i1.p1 TRINITY_DN12926_c0_g1~~TRINITY_DN12926_c0_g1_i1.p1  ORF type:complete len:185 (-),score=24.37 TRINITY_DN12926_c0_g1_i1:88-642(-)